MDIQDLAGFTVLALLLCCPLIPIYLTLKLLDWNQQAKLFLDSWFVYLSWLVSGLLVLLVAIYFDSFWAFWAILIIVNTLAVAATLRWTIKAKKTTTIFADERGENLADGKQKIMRTSFFISIITILTMFAVFFVATSIDNLIKKAYPKPKTSFGIYD